MNETSSWIKKTISGITDAEGKTEKISSLSMVKAELTILGRKDD